MLVVDVQAWWSMYELRTVEHGSVVAFGGVVMHTICLYMAAALVLPDASVTR